MLMFEPEAHVQSRRATDTFKDMKIITLKVMLRKSNSKVLYAETQEDFVNFLIALPSLTLGSWVKLLEKPTSLECISYRSLEGLIVDRYMKSEHLKAKLLSPKFGVELAFRNSTSTEYQMTTIHNDDCKTIHVDSTSLIFRNVDCPTLETLGDYRFIKGPAMYMVTDDLIVTPLSPILSVSILNRLEVPISDLEVRVVSFGKEEAQRLLEASLISKSALTIAFNSSVS